MPNIKMALKELVIIVFMGYSVVNGENCWISDHAGRRFEYCKYGCCDYHRCCGEHEERDNTYLVVVIVCSVVGGILLIIVTSSIVACCCCCKGCLCYKRGQAGKTIAPAPIHIPTERLPPNNRLPPLPTSGLPSTGNRNTAFTGNNFNSYYERGCTFVMPGLPPIRDNVGYHSPQRPPNYNEEPEHPPPYDGRHTTPLTFANNTANNQQAHPVVLSTQRLQPSCPPNEHSEVHRSEPLPSDNPNVPQNFEDHPALNVPSVSHQGSLPPVSNASSSLPPGRSPQGHSALPPIQTFQSSST